MGASTEAAVRQPVGRPRLSRELQELITMTRENPLWGTERIRDELLKLGAVVSSPRSRRFERTRSPNGQLGRFRRECLDQLIPLNERHLRRLLHEAVDNYNHDRPHRSLNFERHP
jgi:hypothetical protein